MKLFYRTFGEGQPMIILHGLFGQSDNWNSLAKQFSEQGFKVFVVDLRNHGLSPQSDVWNYKVMSADVLELVTDNGLTNIVLLGHSMGGKVAMQFAIDNERLLDKLIVVDIAPKQYPVLQELVLDALSAVDFSVVKARKDVDAILSSYITDFGTKQFLLKNIYWKENGEMDWRFNLKVIREQIVNVGEQTPTEISCSTPTLFIRGENSNYILDDDVSLIRDVFPFNMIETIAGAGHWVHAEKPIVFYDTVMKFLK